MSLAEEMLATMGVEDESTTYLSNKDEEEHILINESRAAIVPNSLKTIAVTGDNDIETVTFDCVRYWDGNDLSTFAIYLNYVLPDNTPGTYIPKAITTSDGEDVYHFDWKIKNNITTKSGKISFAITAVKTKQNENGETVVDKQWSSLPNGDCSIALGLGISNVPTEEESSDVVAQLSAILEQIHADVDEWIKTVVVQTTGTSQTQVMSQNAVTSSLNSYKEESIQQSNVYTDSKYNLLDKKILQNSNKISRNSKRITNLEQGLPSEQFMTDSTVAYTKDVPSNALPYASINKIGGMTYKSKNLIPLPYIAGNGTAGGVTYRINSDASISFSGNKTGTSDNIVFDLVNLVLPAGTYHLSGLNATGDYTTFHIGCDIYDMDGTWVNIIYDSGSGETIMLERTMRIHIFIRILSYYTGSVNFTAYPMLNAGATALPYEPYFEGLRSAKVTAVKSVWVNLFGGDVFADKLVAIGGAKDATNGTVSIPAYSTNGKQVYSGFKANTQYTFIFKASVSNAGSINIAIRYTDNTLEIINILNANTITTVTTVSKKDKTIQALVGTLQADTTYYYNECGVFEGVLSLDDFKPYVEHTLPIPEAVQALEGYGLGVNENCYNYIAWNPEDNIKTWNKKCGVVDLGTLDWERITNNSYGDYFHAGFRKGVQQGKGLCGKYQLSTAWHIFNSDINKAFGIEDSYIVIRDTAYTDAASFKAAMSGVMLVYELAEPEVTDISYLITADNLIGVEGGGALIFENEYGYAVPSEVEYQVEV